MAASRNPRSTAVVAIVGGDSYRAEAALERILSQAGLENRAESVQLFRGDETGWARIIDAARTGSLFVERRAVVVRGAEQIKGEGEEVLAFLATPPPDVILVLLAAKPDKRRTLWKRIVERATVEDAEPLKGRALQAYVETEVRRRALRLRDEALVELLERVGQDLRRLIGELDKLEAFAKGGPPLGADDVAKVLGRGLARPLYRLSDAMMQRRAGEVLLLLEERLEEGEPAQRILVTLHRAMRQTRAARALLEARAPRDELVSRLGVPPFKVGDVMEASRQWSEGELRIAIRALAQADRRMKTGGDPRVALTVAVVEACRPRGVPSPRRVGTEPSRGVR